MLTKSLNSLMQRLSGWRSKPVAGADSDPNQFLSALAILPNPDPILRQIGQAEMVYNSIMHDAHVIGEIRSIRGEFRSHKYRVLPGDQGDSKSVAAAELCTKWLANSRPNQVCDWMEVMWQMSASIFTGYRPHELVWDYNTFSGDLGRKNLPVLVADRPGRRFKFDADGNPLLISKNNLMGAPVDPYQFVISRHMPSMVNPYGLALLSTCYWPWSFKTGGWRFFVKFCERHGLPWPYATYPMGTTDDELDRLEEALSDMLENGYIMAPDGTGLSLLESKGSGSMLPQEALINAANREMSKALTGQSMIAELHNVGARAASETALKRQSSINNSDREISTGGMSEIFRWITLFNFGDGIAPPVLDYFKQEAAGKDRAETYQIAVNIGGNPSRKALLDELNIPEAEGPDDMLKAAKSNQQTKVNAPSNGASNIVQNDFGAYLNTVRGFRFAAAAGLTEADAMDLAAVAADDAIERQMLRPIYEMLTRFEADGKTLAEFKAAYEQQIGTQLDDEGLRQVIELAMTYAMSFGAATSTP